MIINFDKIPDIIDLSNLNDKYILSRISELDIFRFYEPKLELGRVICSPLRKDKSPSFGLFRSIGGGIRYKDFSSGEVGNCFNFVKTLFGCNYNEALQIIIKDFNLKNTISTSIKRVNIVEEILNNFEKKILPVKRSFNQYDYFLWNQYYIPLDYLVKDNSYPCKYIYLSRAPNDMILWGEETKDNPIYCFEADNRHKVYRPNSIKESKWLSTFTNFDIQGLKSLPQKDNLLIITSSMKDKWVLNRLGYEAIAPQSESTYIPTKIMDYLFAVYDKIIMFYDNDKAGKEFTKKMITLYPELTGVFIPEEYKEKDISDFIKIHGIDEARSLMKKLI